MNSDGQTNGLQFMIFKGLTTTLNQSINQSINHNDCQSSNLLLFTLVAGNISGTSGISEVVSVSFWCSIKSGEFNLLPCSLKENKHEQSVKILVT
jgi:hypothetical protein